MLELIEKKTAMRLLEAALPTIIDEDSGEYVLGINTAYGLICSIPPVPIDTLKEITLGKRIGCLRSEQSEPKPCPFCGYPAAVESFKERKGYAATVHCCGCLAEITTITYDTEKEAEVRALWAWNRRANDV